MPKDWLSQLHEFFKRVHSPESGTLLKPTYVLPISQISLNQMIFNFLKCSRRRSFIKGLFVDFAICP